MNLRTTFLSLSWLLVFAIALALDTPIARSVHESGLYRKVEGKPWAQVLKEPGEIRFTAGVAVLLLICRQIRIRQSLFILLSGVLSGANGLIKWIVGRTRPYKIPGTQALRPFEFHPFWHGMRGFATQHDLCFPSGHGCTAFALMTALFFVWRRGWWIFLILAVLVGTERVIENAHYTSDVIAAAGFALLCTSLLYQAMQDWVQPAKSRGFDVIRAKSYEVVALVPSPGTPGEG